MSFYRPPQPRLIARGRTRILSHAELDALTKDRVEAYKAARRNFYRPKGGPLRPGIRGAGTERSQFEPRSAFVARPGYLLLLESLASVARRVGAGGLLAFTLLVIDVVFLTVYLVRR